MNRTICDSVADELAELVAGDPDAIDRHADHLAGCDDCRDARHEAARLANLLADAGSDHVEPPDLADRLLALVDAADSATSMERDPTWSPPPAHLATGTAALDTTRTSAAPDTIYASAAPDTIGVSAAPDTTHASAPDIHASAPPDTTRASAPDTTRASAPDTIHASAPPDTTRASAPDTTRASAPDTTRVSDGPDTARVSDGPDTTHASAPDTTRASAPDTTRASAPRDAKQAPAPSGATIPRPHAPRAAHAGRLAPVPAPRAPHRRSRIWIAAGAVAAIAAIGVGIAQLRERGGPASEPVAAPGSAALPAGAIGTIATVERAAADPRGGLEVRTP
ncbi:MAG: hypothetical protein ACTHU0_34430, partial [Kofleriaceae bacterium]